ncbi:MAG: hypothetical protein WBA12_13275, partial [Catalinimonas sp.]
LRHLPRASAAFVLSLVLLAAFAYNAATVVRSESTPHRMAVCYAARTLAGEADQGCRRVSAKKTSPATPYTSRRRNPLLYMLFSPSTFFDHQSTPSATEDEKPPVLKEKLDHPVATTPQVHFFG